MILILSGNQNANHYINTLGRGLLPFVADTFGAEHPWVFQHDGAAIHTAIATRKWLTERQIRTLPWPAKSPDLNIIENVWGFMARTVYKRRKQYSTVDELKQAIRDARDEINSDYIFKLYNSIPRRLMAVIDAKGNATKY